MKIILITTTSSMSDESYSYICDGFRQMLGKEILFKRVIDNSIIGGFIADVGGDIYDASISMQLKKIGEHITA